MTKNIRRWLLASLAVAAVGATGCIITSAQILLHYDLPNPVTINSASDPFERVLVDLNTEEDYADNKDKLKGLTDFAVLGKFVNESGPAGGVEVWVTSGITNYTTVGAITASSTNTSLPDSVRATKLWGAGEIGESGTAEGTVTLSWDASAALFTAAGKKIVIREAQNDGAFTLYTFGTAGVYQIKIENGALVLVLDAGL